MVEERTTSLAEQVSFGHFLLCCGVRDRRPGGLPNAQNTLLCAAKRTAAKQVTSIDVLEERTAMILGMNPKILRAPRPWAAFLWAKRRHWALVLQPLGEAFEARVVDDFIYNAQDCYSGDLESTRFFLVYEMLLEGANPFLMVSVKPDFSSSYEPVHFLGRVAPCNLEDLKSKAMEVVSLYRSYSFIGCNCQHFATDLARQLGLLCAVIPDDEAVAHAASDAALAVGVAGAAVAMTTAAGAGVVSVLAAAGSAPVVLGTVPVVLSTVALSAFSFSLVGGAALIGVAGGYRALYEGLRDSNEDAEEGDSVTCHCPSQSEHHSPLILTANKAAQLRSQQLKHEALPNLRASPMAEPLSATASVSTVPLTPIAKLLLGQEGIVGAARRGAPVLLCQRPRRSVSSISIKEIKEQSKSQIQLPNEVKRSSRVPRRSRSSAPALTADSTKGSFQ